MRYKIFDTTQIIDPRIWVVISESAGKTGHPYSRHLAQTLYYNKDKFLDLQTALWITQNYQRWTHVLDVERFKAVINSILEITGTLRNSTVHYTV